MSPDCEGDDNELVESGKLHTRCASPRRLTQELAQLLEGARFMVEVRNGFFVIVYWAVGCSVMFMLTDTMQMRHNVYHISSTKKFNLVSFWKSSTLERCLGH